MGLLLVLANAPGDALASDRLERVRAAGTLRACIWPEYFGITFRDARTGELRGIDIDLARAFAADLGVKVAFVDSAFPRFIGDLRDDRCDIAMFAVGVTRERAASVAFSQPYLRSDIHAIATRSNKSVTRWDDIDRAGVVVAVAAGTFMEPVMRDALKNAKLMVVKAPQTREEEVESGRADVFMTDYPYSRRLLATSDWARLISPEKPFHVVSYAYAVKPGDDAWLRRVDRFVADVKRDGRLRAAAATHGLSPIVVGE